jgi:hypothetical protein
LRTYLKNTQREKRLVEWLKWHAWFFSSIFLF